MGDFGTAVRYLDWVKSRQATLQEAENFPVPFSKYYGIKPSRQFKKIPFVLNVPKHIISSDINVYQYLPRLVFQYNITLPFSSYILNIDGLNNNTLLSGITTVKWVDINTGAVSRYGLKSGNIGNYNLCDVYHNQRLPKQFSIEYWLGSTFFGHCGINDDFEFILSPITNPLFPEELERDIFINGPHDFPEFSWNTPFNIPQINNIVPWPLPDIDIGVKFLTDENGKFITDENGNFIIV